MAYVKFEQRYGELERARKVFQRFVNVHPQPKNWLKWSKFEEQNGDIGKLDIKKHFFIILILEKAREIYEQCSETLGHFFNEQNIFVSFAKFEIRQKEIERARMIYKYGLEQLPKGQAENLYNSYTQFEKQYGGKDGIEDVVIQKRRTKY